DVKIAHVPFSGTGAAIPAVLSNQVGAMWGFTAGLIPHIRAGTLRALAIGSRERSPALPEVPTVAEAGVPGYEAVSWIGLPAPSGTPADTLARLGGAGRGAGSNDKGGPTDQNRRRRDRAGSAGGS